MTHRAFQNKTVVSVFGFAARRFGAGEIFARELSVQLAERGWHSVLCFLEPPTDAMRKFFDLPNVSIEVIEDCWQVSGKATVRLYEVLRKYRPGILHLYYTGFLSAYPWLARSMGASLVYFTDQSSQPEGFVPTRAPLWKRLAMRVINRPIDGVISVSKYGYDNFTTRDLLPKERFHIIYNSVDVERAALGMARAADFRRRLRIPADRLVVTQVSWLIPEKGLDDLLLAARDVAAAEPNVQFLLVGDGAHRANLENKAKELGIAPKVMFPGVVSDPLADGLYAASDVVCQMSRWEEVFGFVNAEAMASYKPLVGTSVGGIPEIIEDGVSGFLVPRRDPAVMASRILELLRDRALRQRMGDAGRRIVEQKFSHKTNIKQLIRLYGI
jgi:glycosyltransferase involved in cell wall biosynthesis